MFEWVLDISQNFELWETQKIICYKGVLRVLWNIYDGAFLWKYWTVYFRQKVPSWQGLFASLSNEFTKYLFYIISLKGKMLNL